MTPKGKLHAYGGGQQGLRLPFRFLLRFPLRFAALLAAALTLALAAPLSQAQFTTVPSPLLQGAPRASDAEIESEYRIDAARHLYSAYPMRVYRGKLPPLLYSVMMVEIEIDAAGQVLDITVIRKPAADEVAPWVMAMVKRAGPFPAPARISGPSVKFKEVWFVDRSGLFQLMTLTEGQR